MATSLQTSSGVLPLHESPMDALYQPRPSDAYAPPLDNAIRLAREDLKVQQGANIHDREAMIRAAVTLEVRLRLLLAALDADRGEAGCAAADVSEAVSL